jgi:3-oxoacyl-[acyl-carrier protein] reductase
MPCAIITGTSRGLGFALASRLLELGWKVHGFSRQAKGPLHASFTAHSVDVGDALAVQRAVDQVMALDKIDLLVNNAGAASLNAYLLTPSSVVANIMQVNFFGTFHMMQAVGKGMVRQRRGDIINITTVAVPLALPGEAAYVASKAAVEGLTQVAAQELASSGVHVQAIGFGPIATDLTRAVSPTQLAALNQRIGRPQGTSMDEAVDFILQCYQQRQPGLHYLAATLPKPF